MSDAPRLTHLTHHAAVRQPATPQETAIPDASDASDAHSCKRGWVLARGQVEGGIDRGGGVEEQGEDPPEGIKRKVRQSASVRQVRQTAPRAGEVVRGAATLETLAARVAGLHLSWTDPEAFHLEKFTVASELRRLARELRRAA